MIKETVLLGYSGHAYVAIDCLAHNHKIVGYTEFEEKTSNPFNLKYLGKENDLGNSADHYSFFPAVGNNIIRKKLVHFIKESGKQGTTAIHQCATISQMAQIGTSTMIGPNATVNALAHIGDGVIINSGSIIEHECRIEDYVHIAPGAVLAGNVTIKEGAFVGANSTIKEGITIGKNAIIGAGAVVLQDIPDGESWVGIPAKPLNHGK